MLAVYARSEDLIRIGAYKTGSDPALDAAIASRGRIRAYLEQDAAQRVTFGQALEQLMTLAASL
jgi:flagellum-specific ATP synthase